MQKCHTPMSDPVILQQFCCEREADIYDPPCVVNVITNQHTENTDQRNESAKFAGAVHGTHDPRDIQEQRDKKMGTQDNVIQRHPILSRLKYGIGNKDQ